MKLRWKLLVLYILLLSLSAGLYCFWTAEWLSRLQRESVESQLRRALRSLSPFLDPSDPEVRAKVVQAGSDLALPITLFDREGRVQILSTDAVVASQPIHPLEKAEFRQATLAEFGVRQEGGMLYVARALPGNRGFLRIEAPLKSRGSFMKGLTTLLLAPGMVLVVVGVALTLLVSHGVTQSIRDLTRTAQQFARGHVNTTVPAAQGEIGKLAESMNAMALQFQRRLTQVGSERNHLDAVLNSMNEGVMVTDQRNRIRDTNPAFLRIFRLDSDPKGKMPLEVIRSSDLMAAIRKTARELQPFETEISFADKTLLARFSPIRLHGEEGGVVTVFHDITEVRSLERARQDFVANVSHELKTPLTSIRGYAETLEDEEGLQPIQREFAQKIRKNAAQLQEIVEAVLEMSRVDGGKGSPGADSIHFDSFVSGLERSFAAQLRAKGISWKVSNKSGLATFRAVEPYLQRVLYNLIDNALKYTSKGEIRIGLELHEGNLLFTVGDTGVGVPPEDRERVFERFYRVPASRSLAPGSGIGLSIVRHIVQLQGGTVWLEGELEKGTTVSFTLPLADEDAKAGGRDS